MFSLIYDLQPKEAKEGRENGLKSNGKRIYEKLIIARVR